MASAPPLPRPAAPADDYIRPGRSAWMDIDWREHQRWLRVGGRRLNVIDAGEGDPVVFVHGLAGSWQNWLENLPHFMRSHRVIALDLPGFGFSEMPAEGISIEAYGRCLDEALGELGIEHAVVVGNSMGGFVGCELALARSHRVQRLVLVAAAVLWNERRRARPLLTLAQITSAYTTVAFSQWEMAARRRRLRVGVLSQVVHRPHRLPPELAYEQLRRVGSPEAFTLALAALYDYRLRDRLAEISCPTLIVWGTNDQLVPVHHANEIAQLIPGARKVIFERTGHMPQIERPARFNPLLEEFLAEDA